MNAHHPPLLPDKAVLATFAEAMFRHADPDTYIVMKAFDGSDAPVFPADGIKVSHSKLADFAYNRSRQTMQWPRPAAFCPPVATFRQTFTEKGKWSATADDIANGVAISVDADQSPMAGRETLIGLLGQPTLITASGGLWGNPETGEVEEKVHLHWRLKDATRTPEDHALLYEARWLACMLIDGDISLVPLSHPLRWPGSVHNKAEPRLSSIISQTENEVDLVEALTVLRTAWDGLPFNAPRGAAAGSANYEKTAAHADIVSAMQVIPNADLTWPAWKRFAMAIYAATDGKGFDLFDAWSKTSKKYNAGATSEAWGKIVKSPPARIGAGTIFYAANQADPRWVKPSSQISIDLGADRFVELGEADGRATVRVVEDPYPLIFHGDPDDTPMREWLVDEVLPKVGTALLTAQWGTYKTFTGFDLSAAVMSGGSFAGRQVDRTGAVLWIAVEGQSEVRIRLAAVAEEKIRPAIDGHTVTLDPEHLPFAWVKACPKLSDPTALPKFRAIIAKAVAEFRKRFDLPLALVIIDTLSPAAEFKDANDTAENQRVMTVLKTVAVEFDTLLVAVDHMGKDTSTGTRNSSVKEADVDAVMALLGEKDLAGNVANPRFAMRKVRGAPTGWEVKFDKRVVTVGSGIQAATTLVIDWAAGCRQRAEQTEGREITMEHCSRANAQRLPRTHAD